MTTKNTRKPLTKSKPQARVLALGTGSASVRLPCQWCQGRGVLDFGRGEGDCPHCDCGEVDVTPAEVAEMELYEEDIRRGLDPGQNSFFKRSNCGDCDPCLGGRADQCAIFPSPNS